MRSKTSWYKKEIGKQDIRNVGWVGIVYFCALVFALPLEVLMRLSSDMRNYYQDEMTLFTYHPEILILSMYVIPVFLGIFLFRYLQVKGASDFIHSLPLKREKLFHHHLLTGIGMLVVPVFVIAIILMIMSGTMDVSNYYRLIDIGYWAGVTIVVNLLIFLATVLVGTFTGISAVQGILTYVLLLFPAGIIVLIYFNLDYVLIGFSQNYYMTYNVEEFSPLTDLMELYYEEFTSTKAIIYLGLSVLFYFLSKLIYKRRKLEGATQAIAFNQLRPIFKYGVTFCTTLLGGFYFGQTQDQYYWIIIGYFIGSTIGYLVAEMLLQKTWRVFGKWKGYLYYLIAIAVLFVVISLDITGYENRIPDTDEIEEVYLSNYPYYVNEVRSNPDSLVEGFRYLTTEENIEAVRTLHQQLIEETERNDSRSYWESMVIGYELKNGDTVVREYTIKDEKEAFDPYLKPIYESREYKQINNSILRIKNEDIEKLTFTSYIVQKEAVVLDPEQISEGLDILRQDIYDQTYEEIESNNDIRTEIRVLLSNNEEIFVPLKVSYSNFLQWLKDNKLYEQTVITPNDVKRVGITYMGHGSDDPFERLITRSSNDENVLFIEDKDQMEELIHIQPKDLVNDRNYMIAIFFEESEETYTDIISEEQLPGFVLEYFKQQ